MPTSKSRAVSESVKKTVWAQSAGRCTNPECLAELTRPDAPPIGQMAHIKPYSEGGLQTVDNLLALCPNCHEMIDSEPEPSRTERMRAWQDERRNLIESLFAKRFDNFQQLKGHVRPYLQRNALIFSTYGPDSTDSSERERYTHWQQHELELITNNERILLSLQANSHLLTEEDQEIVILFEGHVKEFLATRGAPKSTRRLLFPDGLHDLFDLRQGSKQRATNKPRHLSAFIRKLEKESRLLGFSLVPKPILNFRLLNGQSRELDLTQHVPLLEDYRPEGSQSLGPMKADQQQHDYVERQLDRLGIPWEPAELGRLADYLLFDRWSLKMARGYVITKTELLDLPPAPNLIVVNNYHWGAATFTDDAYGYAKRHGMMLMDQEGLFEWALKTKETLSGESC